MLEYFALFLVFFVVITLFYGIIVIHDIPYDIAVHRGHPHQDAIHVAGWISLVFLGVIWPFLWIWAMLYKPGVGWGMQHNIEPKESEISKQMADLQKELASIKADLAAVKGDKA